MNRHDSALRAARILIVDDDPVMRHFLERFLDAHGMRNILTVEDGWDGLEILFQCGDEIDLVILDLQMPVLDGFEFLRRLRSEDSPCRDMSVLVLTGVHDENVVRQCAELGQGFVVKPIDMEQFSRRLRSALDRGAASELRREDPASRTG